MLRTATPFLDGNKTWINRSYIAQKLIAIIQVRRVRINKSLIRCLGAGSVLHNVQRITGSRTFFNYLRPLISFEISETYLPADSHFHGCRRGAGCAHQWQDHWSEVFSCHSLPGRQPKSSVIIEGVSYHITDPHQ